jgi:XTP/dITP diphosphohydrolase
MSRRLLFATTNEGKLRELRGLAGDLEVVSLKEVSPLPPVDEDEDTLLGNARKKAHAYARASGLVALADDSGLFVDALGGRPGVHSARYASGSDADRVKKLLAELAGVPRAQRGASFQCVLCLASPQGQEVWTDGECRGEVLELPRGQGGFGYDPVLQVPSFGKSMAELTLEEKAQVSHRGQAFRRMVPHLKALAEGHWP